MRRVLLLAVLLVASAFVVPGAAAPVAAAETVGWQTPELIESDYWGSAIVPRVGVDAAGNAIAVWIQDDGTAYHVRANRYVPGAGWGAPVTIDTPTTGQPNLPELAVAASGTAFAIWSVYDGVANTTIYANRFSPGAGWGGLEVVNVSAGFPSPLKVGLDAAGNAIALWPSSEGGSSALYSARYVADTGWGAPASVPVPALLFNDPRLAVDAGGNATAVYTAYTGSTFPVYANRFAPGSGWSAPELLESAPGGQTPYPDVAADPAGNAIAVWEAHGTGGTDIRARRFAPGSGWDSLQLLETNSTTYAHRPQVAMDASGDGLAVWTEQNATGFAVRSNRFVPGSGWGAAAQVAAVAGGEPPFLDLAASPQGEAVAAWWEFGSGFMSGYVRASIFVPGSGWGAATLLQPTETGTFSEPRAAMDASGRAVVVWYNTDGALYHIVANRYVPGTGWTGREAVESDTADALMPTVAVDAAGNATAAWVQLDLTGFGIYANRYTVGTGWGDPVALGQGCHGLDPPQIAMDGTGGAIAVWNCMNATAGSSWARRYTPATGWGDAVLLSSGSDVQVNYARIAVRPDGSAVAAWSAFNGTNTSAWVRVFDVETGWDPAEPLALPGASGSFLPSVAVGAGGDALAAWIEPVSGGAHLMARQYVPGSGWGAPEPVVADLIPGMTDLQMGMDGTGHALFTWSAYNMTGWHLFATRYAPGEGGDPPETLAGAPSISFPQLAVDLQGNAVSVRSQTDATGLHIVAQRYVPGAGWGKATFLESDATAVDVYGDVGLDAHGNAMVAWFRAGSVPTLYAARYSSRSGWGDPVPLQKVGSGILGPVQIAVGRDGAAFVVWSQPRGSSPPADVWAARYVSPDVIPPVADAGPDRSVAVGDLFTFNGSASTDNVGVTSYRWTFDDGGVRTLTGVSPTYSFDHAGTVTVILQVADAEENTATDTMTITVTPAPDITRPLAEAGPDQSVQVGDVVTFDASSSTDNFGVTSYSWSLNDGQERTLSGVSPTYTFNQPGTYVVTLNVTDAAGNFDTDTLLVSVASTTGSEAFPPLAIGIIAALAVLAGVLGALFILQRRREGQAPPPAEPPAEPPTEGPKPPGP